MSKIELSDITQTAGFRAPPSYIYEALTNEKQMSGYTQTPCTLDVKEGGSFSIFGGSVTGKYTKVSPNELQYTWRFKEWADDQYSQVKITLEAVDSSSTKLTLTQTGIPHLDRYGNAGQVEKVEQGWQTFFWLRIQARATTGHNTAEQ
jgi:activator of HSP90 ATPase